MQDLVDSLKKLGLTEYEAKAYAAMVGLGEATAREIHQASGVPRTRIYDILGGLADKGFVEFIQGSPTYYRVVEPERVLERLREDLLEAIDISERELKNLNLEVQGSSPVWCVRSGWAIENRIRDFLGTVDCDLLIFSRSPEFLSHHRSEIKKHKLRMIIVDDAKKFEGLGWDLRVLRPECIEMFYGWTGEDSSFIPDCVMVKVGKESLVIGKTGQETMAIIMRLPIVTMLQKTLLQSLIMPQSEDEA